MTQQTIKYSYIDSLRGYAVLMVLLSHTYIYSCNVDKSIFLSNLWVQCRMGVMLFFMVSALTLFLSLDKKIKKEKFPIRNFFIRRFFRIAPLFYIILIGYLFFDQYNLLNIISTFSFTNGFLPDIIAHPIIRVGWTLAVEMIFYLMLPVLYKKIKSISNAVIFFVITVIFSVITKYLAIKYLNVYYENLTLIGFTYYWLPAQLPVFALGITLYYILFKTDFNTKSELKYKRALGYIFIFCGIYFVATLSYSSKLFITENIAFSFALMLFVIGMAINSTSIFNNIAVQFLGKISYSFYLIHLIIIKAFLKYLPAFNFEGNKRFVVAFAGILLIASVISYFSYLFIEQPFQKLGARIIKKLESNKTTSQLEYDTASK